MHIRTALAGLATAFCFWLLIAGGALAHSRLVSSNPPSGAVLAKPPATIQMTFSEGAVPEFSSFAVLDRARQHYETSQPPATTPAGQATVFLQSQMPSGAYIVQWKVVSMVDGHLTRGSFVFTVQGAAAAASPSPATGGAPPGSPSPTPEAQPAEQGSTGNTSESPPPSTLDVLVRWLSALLAATMVGGAAFRLLVVPAGLGRLGEQRAALQHRLDLRTLLGSLGVAWLLLVSLFAELLLQAARATESDIFAVLARRTVLGTVLSTSFGVSLEWRALLGLAIFGLLAFELAFGSFGRAFWGLVLLLGAGYFIAETISAHAAALSQQAGAKWLQELAPAANVIHLLGTAVWVGGLFYFVLILLPLLPAVTPETRASMLQGCVRRFTAVALVSVPVLATSGLLLYLAERPSVASTLGTDYGRDVLIKVALLGLLMIPAAYNLRRVGPGLARLRGQVGPAFSRLARGFGRSVRLEALLVSLVLVFAALLTLSAPATDPTIAAGSAPATAVAQAAPPTETPAPLPTGPLASTLTVSQTVRGVDVALTTAHSTVDEIAVQLRDARGPVTGCPATPTPNADCALSVKLTLTQLEDNTSDTLVVDDAGGGRYELPTAPYLALDGNWQVVVVVRRYNQPDDVKAAFRYSVAGSALTGKVSDYVNVDVATNPAPPRSGPVSFVFRLTDSNGRPVNDATVTMQGIMPTHGHVTELTPLKAVSGAYSGSLLMPMSGGWAVELSIARPGHETLAAEVALDVQKSEYDLTPYPTPNITPSAP